VRSFLFAHHTRISTKLKKDHFTMANLAATVAALETYCGFPAARSRTVARRLLDNELLSPGGPGVAVEVNEADLVLLLLAVASGAPLSKVANVTAQLAEAVPDGVDVDVMPEGIRPLKRTAFDILHNLICNAAHSGAQMKFDVEVVGTWPEVAFHGGDGVARFVPAGAPADRWQSDKQRKSTTIPHAALYLAARNLFGAR
jgi:hypothetical protein